MYSHDIVGVGQDSLKLTMRLRQFSMLDANLLLPWSLNCCFGFPVFWSNTTALISAEEVWPRQLQQHQISVIILLLLWLSAFCFCRRNQTTVQISLLGFPQHVLRECSREEKLEMATNSIGCACLLHTMRGEGNSCLVSSYSEKYQLKDERTTCFLSCLQHIVLPVYTFLMEMLRICSHTTLLNVKDSIKGQS